MATSRSCWKGKWRRQSFPTLAAFPAQLTTAQGIEGSDFLSTFENIRHLADLCERGAVGPGVNHVHQVRLELVQIRLLVHVQLGVCRDFGDALRTLLKTTEEDGVLVYSQV